MIDLKLVVMPSRLSMSERATFQAGLEAINRGAAAVDPHLADATLSIDGRHLPDWDRALRCAPSSAPPWCRLSPAERLSIWWSPGERLFDGPGRYHLVLRLGDLEAAADVEITP